MLVEAGATRVLLDFGLSPRETARRLARRGLAPSDIAAVVVTHEHDDHVGHAFAFSAQQGVPVWLTHGTLRAVQEARKPGAPEIDLELNIEDRSAFAIGDLQVQPYTVPHDAREPVQFVFSDGASRLGVLTDIGAPTPHVEASLSGCDALVLETNHDLDLLWGGEYPRWLKERVSGPWGHLDNGQAERLLRAIDRTRLKHVVAAHLSQQNNRPELARAALARAMGCEEDWVEVATQEDGFGWRDLR
ncbi:MAG: MBL fold metallo-hydrolase [Betaproteobacteria bacterium]|nr:MBL fold metallo-hydrolase [Betaproteobacteria bacterium]